MPIDPEPLSPPSPWVLRWLQAIKAGGTVLDVACGRGRHIVAALQVGLRVTGVDRDLAGNRFKGHADVELMETDLGTEAGWPLGSRRFDGVVVTNYLHRPILPDIVASVATDGVLIYETFAVGQERLGRPTRPAFLLDPGELLEVVRGKLVPLAYEHVRLAAPERLVQRIAAVGVDHAWLSDPPRLPRDC